MNVAQIIKPLPGEHLATTSPTMQPEVAADWRQRLNFWAGRALTAGALEIEQEHRAAHLAWQGRIPTPGIVTGLEVGLEEPPPPDPLNPAPPLAKAGHFIHVLPGYGLTVFGEDVIVPRPLAIPLEKIPIRVTALESGGGQLDVDDFREGHIPWAAVLVARPTEFPGFGKVDPDDPCEIDLSRDAFADERRLDATALCLFQLPASFENDPLLADHNDPRWRNRLANAVFNAEKIGAARQFLRVREDPGPAKEKHWDTVLKEGMILPWEYFGVPIALLSSEAGKDGVRRFFLDRAAVARPGGRARARSRAATLFATGEKDFALQAPGSGTPTLWRARVDQFAEHLASLAEIEAAEQAAHFQFVPPVGLLPREALDFLTTEQAVVPALANADQPPDRAAVSKFFPPNFAVEAVPIPTEDLDAVLAFSAPLAPFDFATRDVDVVRVLVPVPQRLFDPRLLVVELEDPFFAIEVGRLIGVRQDWRQRRDFVRSIVEDRQNLIREPQPSAPTPALEAGQIELEPVESNEQLNFGAMYLSPTETAGPWEISGDFVGAEAGELTPDTVLFVRLRIDLDQPPSQIEMRWQRGRDEFRHIWTAPSDIQIGRLDPNGAPLPLALWRLYTVTAKELGVTSGRLASFTLRLDDGRVGLIDAGKFIKSKSLVPDRIAWWNARENAAATRFSGSAWMRLEDGAHLRAPFEQSYEPIFPDGKNLDARLTEIDTKLNLPAAGQVRKVGLSKVIDELQSVLNKANDAVDLGFLTAQTNIHRIRQVMLGEEVANDLLTSPALASVVKASSARVAQADLINSLKETKLTNPLERTTVPLREETFGERAATTTAFTPLSDGIVRPPGLGNIGPIVRDPVIRVSGLPSRLPTFPIRDLIPTRDDIIHAEPAVGKGFELRTLTIAKRFDPGLTRTSYDFADTGLLEILRNVIAFDLGYDDTPIPDVQEGNRKDPVSFERLFNEGAPLLAKLHAPALASEDDGSKILAQGVRRADATVLVLRRLEFYIARRRELLGSAQEVLAALSTQLAAANARLAVIAGPLAEARHDVSVARALRQEEQDRVAAINTRRDAMIRDEVTFLAYVRPRAVDPVRRRVPGWKLESADTLAPVPACLQRHDQPPDPLRAYVQLFRHAPASWFIDIAPRLRELDTPEKLSELLAATQHSALVFSTEKRVAFATTTTSAATQSALLSAFSIVEASRTRAAGLQLVRPGLHSWTDLHHEAEQHSSLGDIIDGRHGHPALARAAADVLQQIEEVATCLHADFAAVPPAIRLIWVERYSQFDRPAPLDNLTSLPRYGSLDRTTRRRFQAFADWLFGRVKTRERDAFNLINDLVRICLLLASHAPVKTLIAGHLPRPVPVRPGVLIPVHAFDPRLVRVGMEVHVWQAEKVVAHALVEDLNENGEVSARVERLQTNTTMLDQTMRVQFIPAALGFSKTLRLT